MSAREFAKKKLGFAGKMQRDSVFGGVLFQVSLTVSVLQFLLMLALQRYLPKESFSQLSTILAFLPQFLIFVDLGLHQELVRLLSLDSANSESMQERLDSALSLRLLGALLGILVFLVSAFFADYSLHFTVGTFFLLLSLFPTAFLQNMEVLGIHRRQIMASVGIKLAKVLGLAGFCLILFAGYWTLGLDPGLSWYFLAFPLCYFLVAWLLRQDQKIRFGFGSARAELTKSWQIVVNRYFSALFGLLTLFFHIRWHGEQNLAEFNLAYVLLAPFSILGQIVLSLVAARLFSTEKRMQLSQALLLSIAYFLFLLGSGYFLTRPMVIDLVFAKIDHQIFFDMLIPIFLTQGMVLWIFTMNLMFQHFEEKNLLVKIGFAGLVALLVGAFYIEWTGKYEASAWILVLMNGITILTIQYFFKKYKILQRLRQEHPN